MYMYFTIKMNAKRVPSSSSWEKNITTKYNTCIPKFWDFRILNFNLISWESKISDGLEMTEEHILLHFVGIWDTTYLGNTMQSGLKIWITWMFFVLFSPLDNWGPAVIQNLNQHQKLNLWSYVTSPNWIFYQIFV